MSKMLTRRITVYFAEKTLGVDIFHFEGGHEPELLGGSAA